MKKVFYADGLFFFSIGCINFPLIVMDLTMKTALLIRREARPNRTHILKITIPEASFRTHSSGKQRSGEKYPLPGNRDLSRNPFPPSPFEIFRNSEP